MKKKQNAIGFWILAIILSIPTGYFAADVWSGKRRILGTEQAMLDVSECNQDGDCVIDEKCLYPQGSLFQYVDNNADGQCDYVIEWKPIDDPTYGRFWQLARFGLSPNLTVAIPSTSPQLEGSSFWRLAVCAPINTPPKVIIARARPAIPYTNSIAPPIADKNRFRNRTTMQNYHF